MSDDKLYRRTAIDYLTKGKLQIEDDAAVSTGDGGAWVQAWVWVSNESSPDSSVDCHSLG